jgi:hypothetical protein
VRRVVADRPVEEVYKVTKTHFDKYLKVYPSETE